MGPDGTPSTLGSTSFASSISSLPFSWSQTALSSLTSTLSRAADHSAEVPRCSLLPAKPGTLFLPWRDPAEEGTVQNGIESVGERPVHERLGEPEDETRRGEPAEARQNSLEQPRG